MNNLKFLAAVLLLLLNSVTTMAATQPAMADQMRAEGKIYVVVAIILIVLAGLFTYLFILDKKVNRLESMLREKRQTK